MDKVIRIGSVQYFLVGDRLRIVQTGDTAFDVSLSPTFDGEHIKIMKWKRVGANRFETSLGKYGRAIMCEQFDKLAYWIETPLKQFDNVTYLSDGIISGQHWRTFVSDEYERIWHKSVDTNIPLSSAYAVSASPDGTSGGG